MSDRGERIFLWALTLVVGAGLCWFGIVDGPGIGRFAFAVLGAALMIFAIPRIQRLRRRVSRSRRFD